MNTLFSKKVGWSIGTVCIVLIISSGALLFFDTDRVESVLVGGTVYSLEIADTEATQILGLGNRESLCGTCGMLFVFKREERHSFWMHGMKFPIDIAWINKENRIIHLERRVSEHSTEVYRPPAPVSLVLELPAGAFDTLSIGEQVNFQKEKH